MRIAYVANYQGPDLLKRRPCMHNLSLAARVKIQLIAELLQASSHEVELLSQGSTEPLVGMEKFRLRYYPALSERELFHPQIPIYYASALSARFLIGFWESLQSRRLLAARHRAKPFDAVLIYNLHRGQIGCARQAVRQGLPVVLQYEDDPFCDVQGQARRGLLKKYHLSGSREVLKIVSGGMGVSPYLLSQMPEQIPKLLLRGVVSGEILKLRQGTTPPKKNWVVFSGTHEGTQGLEQMVKAWRGLGAGVSGWELHIAGQGPITSTLEKLAAGDATIVFHGLLNRAENARLLCAAKIGMNAQDLTKTPGNVFAFKIVEYLAAGVHVITTPRGFLEPELEAGITYVTDNTPDHIAACLKEVIQQGRYERIAEEAAIRTYGPAAVSDSLNRLFAQVSLAAGNKLPVTKPGTAAADAPVA